MDIKEFLINTEEYKKIDKWIDAHLDSYLKLLKDNKLLTNERLERHEIEHIVDYLKHNKNDERSRITRLGVLEANRQAKLWTNRLNKRVKDVDESEEDVEIVLDHGDGFYWVELKTDKSYKREGKLMGHCVGGYFGKECRIYSLRDSFNDPHCTIEHADGSYKRISQIKGRANTAVVSKYHKYVCQFLDSLNVSEIAPYDLETNGLILASGKIYFISSLPEGLTIESNLKVVNPQMMPNKISGTEKSELTLIFKKSDIGEFSRYGYSSKDVSCSKKIYDGSEWDFKRYTFAGLRGVFKNPINIKSINCIKSNIDFNDIICKETVTLDNSQNVNYKSIQSNKIIVQNCDEFVVDERITAQEIAFIKVKRVIFKDNVKIRKMSFNEVDEVSCEGSISSYNIEASKTGFKSDFFTKVTLDLVPGGLGALRLETIKGVTNLKFAKYTNLTMLMIRGSTIKKITDIGGVALLVNEPFFIERENSVFKGDY